VEFDIITFIQSVGVPTAICGFLLVRIERRMMEVRDAVVKLTEQHIRQLRYP